MDYVASLGLICDIVGAGLLARGLALENLKDYVRHGAAPLTVGALEGIDPPRDLAHAREWADMRIGFALIVLGFAGQFAAADEIGDVTREGAALTLAAVFLVAWWGRLRLVAHAEREIFLARVAGPLGLYSNPAGSYELSIAYMMHFKATGRDPSVVEKWEEVATRRRGQHPWAELRKSRGGW